MNQSPAIAALSEALAKAQAEVGKAHKDSNNPFFKSKYADLESVYDACRDALAANGLSVVQAPAYIEGHPELVALDTRLCHASGEWLEGRFVVRPVKDDPQACGSAITYLRRYSIQAMVGVSSTDDDGEAASGTMQRQDAPKAPRTPPARQPAPTPTPRAVTPPAPRPPADMGDLPDTFGGPAPKHPEAFIANPAEKPAPEGMEPAQQWRRRYFARAKDCGMTTADMGDLAKRVTGRDSSEQFTVADREAAMRRIDLACDFLVWATDVAALDEAAAKLLAFRKCGAVWDQPWPPAVVAKVRAEMGLETGGELLP